MPLSKMGMAKYTLLLSKSSNQYIVFLLILQVHLNH